MFTGPCTSTIKRRPTKWARSPKGWMPNRES
ncbi:hypothetical protein BH23GEM10_BH23GEM10_07510 [soil metagenome]